MTNQTRSRRRLLITAGVLAIPLAALAWWLGSPLFLDTTVDETFPTVEASVGSNGADTRTVEKGETDMVEATPQDSVESQETTPGPTVLVAGSFVDADSAHRGSGSATLYELPDGSLALRFEEFEVTNGPDLHVSLVPTSGPIDRGLLADVGYEDLGKLKGNVGNQNYEIPGDLDLEGPWTVVIYCDPFHVVFSTAQLSG